MRRQRFTCRRGAWIAAAILTTALGACDDDEGSANANKDAAAADAGAADAATADAAGSAPDAGTAGDRASDLAASTADAGAADVRPDVVAAMCPAKPAEAECDPVASEVVPLSDKRVRHCAFDIGSTNVKVVITSIVTGDSASIEGDRVCKKALRLRDKTQDPMTMMGRPLTEADMDVLVAQLKTYGAICTSDKGTILGAVATQWARNATNQEEIKTWFKAKMGLDLNILTGDQEGAYGYAAATHGALDRAIIDVGGGSFQVSFWATGDAKPTAASVPFGQDAASDAVWTKAEFTSYAPARTAFVTELKKRIGATAATAAALDRLKELVTTGKVNGELISLGDSGVILAVEGKLQDASGHWVDELTYLKRLDERRKELAMSTAMGPKKTLSVKAVDAFLEQLAMNNASFEELRSECIRKAYGGKVLGYLTLVSQLAKDYGLSDRVVFTSGEMAEGFMLEKLR